MSCFRVFLWNNIPHIYVLNTFRRAESNSVYIDYDDYDCCRPFETDH